MWINHKFEKEEAHSMSSGLQKSVFAYEKDRNSHRPIEPIVRQPKKKTQDELWNELLGFEERNLYLTYVDS